MTRRRWTVRRRGRGLPSRTSVRCGAVPSGAHRWAQQRSALREAVEAEDRGARPSRRSAVRGAPRRGRVTASSSPAAHPVQRRPRGPRPRRRRACSDGRDQVTPELVLLVLVPGPRVRGRAPAGARRPAADVRLDRPARGAGRPRLGRDRRGRAAGRDRPAVRARHRRRARWSPRRIPWPSSRRSGGWARRGGCRRSSRARACSTTAPRSCCSRSTVRAVQASVTVPEVAAAAAITVAVVSIAHRSRRRLARVAADRGSSTTTAIELRSRSSSPTARTSLADALHQSGIIATVVAGVVIGNYGRAVGLSRERSEALDIVWELIALRAHRVRVPARRARDLGRRPGGARRRRSCGVSSAILVGRVVVVYGLLGGAARLAPATRTHSATSRCGWLHVLFWAGLRGAVAVAMALVAACRLPGARAAPGDHLRGRAVHAVRAGHDGRAGSCRVAGHRGREIRLEPPRREVRDAWAPRTRDPPVDEPQPAEREADAEIERHDVPAVQRDVQQGERRRS